MEKYSDLCNFWNEPQNLHSSSNEVIDDKPVAKVKSFLQDFLDNSI